jgi:RNA recognition motif-containing protein
MEKKAKRRIHVSNIPFELKPDDIKELFDLQGSVLDIETINDKTGKYKGSVKIEFPDYFTAKAAIRNMNRYEIKGR